MYAGVTLNHQPLDLLMQRIEYFFVRAGATRVDEEAHVRPAPILLKHRLARLGEIKTTDV
jgi:hypothetical protein